MASIVLDNTALGKAIARIYDRGIAVTIYVDDIIVSGNDPDTLDQATIIIEKGFLESGFSKKSEKSVHKSSALTVFNIDISHNAIKISQDRMKEFLEIEQTPDGGREYAIVNYVLSVNAVQATELLNAYTRLE